MDENVEGNGAAAPEVNEVEQAARAQGWVPKEEYTGTGRWRSAEDFLDRGELFTKIEAQRREIKNLHQTQQAFHQHLETVRKAEYSRALTALREEKRAAFKEGDADAVLAVDDKMDALKARIQAEQVAAAQAPQVDVQAQAQFQADFNEWRGRNSWYAPTNQAMVDFADAEGRRLTGEGRLTAQEILKEVETRVRREFPQKFTNPNRERAGAVEGGGTKPSKSSKDDFPMSEQDRRTMQRLVKSGALTEEQYKADLKAVHARFPGR